MRRLVFMMLLLSLVPPVWSQDITSNLTLWYKLDETGTTAPQDSSANAFHGTLSGTATRLTGSSCKVLGCFGFSVANSTVVTQGQQLITTLMTVGNGSFGVWVNPHLTPNDRPNLWTLPAVIIDSSGSAAITRGTVSSGPDVFHAWNWVSGTTYNEVTTTYTLDQWTHLVWVHSASTTLTLYKDGVSVGSIATNNTGASGTTIIGESYVGGFFLNADLDELRVYNRALTAPDVQALYQYGLAVLGNRWRMMKRTTILDTMYTWLWPGGQWR